MGHNHVALGDQMEEGGGLRRPPRRVADQLLEPIPSRRQARFVLNVVGRHKLAYHVDVPGGASAVEGVVEALDQILVRFELTGFRGSSLGVCLSQTNAAGDNLKPSCSQPCDRRPPRQTTLVTQPHLLPPSRPVRC